MINYYDSIWKLDHVCFRSHFVSLLHDQPAGGSVQILPIFIDRNNDELDWTEYWFSDRSSTQSSSKALISRVN